MPAADRGGQPVAEIEVGDEALASGHEEAAVPQPGLDPLECPGGLVQLDRVAAGHALSPVPGMIGAGRPACIELLGTTFATLPSV